MIILIPYLFPHNLFPTFSSKTRASASQCVQQTDPVPGAPNNSGNLYDVSQVLAWLAMERRDVQEQLEWREQIPELWNQKELPYDLIPSFTI